jgi:integrase
MRIRVKGLKEYTDRLGNRRRYHRASGTPIDAKLDGAALAAEIDRLDKLHKPQAAKAGTLGGLLASYKASPRFTDLAPRTKSDYQKCMDHLKPIADTPLILLTSGFMAKLRDRTVKKRKGAFTNHMMAMLSSACRHGVEYEMLTANPCVGLDKAKIPDARKKDNRPWSPTERVNVLAAAPPHLKVPLALARFFGIRRGDILKLPRMAYRNGHITFSTGKTGKRMKLPVVGEVKDILDGYLAAVPVETIGVTLLCLNSYNQPWTEMGFTASIRKFFARMVERGIAEEGLTMHGLRHTVAAELRGLGFSLEDIKDFLGQETVEMAGHYASSADISGKLIDMAQAIGRAKN